MNFNNALKPQAKMDNLVVQDLSNEVLIYNLKNNKAYSLNETTTLVWQNCDGKKNVSQIAKTIENVLNQNIPEEFVLLALDNLKKENLISFEDENSSAFTGITRREVIKRVGLATMVALPMIVSVSAPMAAHAQSGSVQACLDCVVAIGAGNTDHCPPASQCANLTCMCWGNNSCNGAGQAGIVTSCEQCAEVTVDGMTTSMNNSFRCV